MSLLDGFLSLGRGINLTKREHHDEVEEGFREPLQEEAELSLSDEKLLDLAKQWEGKWAEYEPEVRKKQEECENYWLGKQFSVAEGNAGRPMVDNVLFEALETFLPVATKRNPEPMVLSDDTPEGQQLVKKVQKTLVYQADRLRFKLKLKKVARYWAIYFLGVLKMGWSEKENDLTCTAIRPTRLILDPDATIEGSEYTGEYIGEVKHETASVLIVRFPKKEKLISDAVSGKLGTKVQYTEWWTERTLFWTLKNELLAKSPNPHWNEDQTQTITDEVGNTQEMVVQGSNHFSHRKKPYIFFSIFNLGKHPHDDTSLLWQNLSTQDLINKRNRQINKNADAANSGLSVSGDYFTEEQAARAERALREGGVVFVPSGDVRAAIQRDQPAQLPAFVYNDLVDKRQRLLDSMGVRGTAPSGLLDEKTVRGKIVVRNSDESRIGGGISEYLEQVADEAFNWMVQLMYVYYDETHYGAVLGQTEGQNLVALKNSDLNRKLTVSVKEGSLIPKDDISRGNQAVDLAASQKMSLVDLYAQLDYPNPQEMAVRAWLEVNAPHMLYGNDPRVMQAIQEQQMAEQQKAQMEQEGTMAQGQQQQEGTMAQIEAKGRQQRAQSVESALLRQVPIPQ